MDVDIQVLVEFKLQRKWTLVDVDPMSSSERSAEVQALLRDLSQSNRPDDLSLGSKYWFEGHSTNDQRLEFLASVSLEDAAHIWWQAVAAPATEFNLASITLNVFGIYSKQYSSYRILIGTL